MDPYVQHRLRECGLSEFTPSKVEETSSQFNNNSDLRTGISSGQVTRGATKLLSIWDAEHKRIEVSYNELGQPDSASALRLSQFIGTVVRDGKRAPLFYENWRKVPEHFKDDIWKIVQDWVMKKSGKKLRDWRSLLKKVYHKEHLSFEDQKNYRDARVYKNQWEHLLRYWATDKAKARREKNKVSRTKRKHNHTMETKSFARVWREKRS